MKGFRQMKRARRSSALSVALLSGACLVAISAYASENVHVFRSHRLYEDFLSNTAVSADGKWMLRSSADGQQTLTDLTSRASAEQRLRAGLESFERASFCGSELLRLATLGGKRTWSMSSKDKALQPVAVPPSNTPLCSSDGRRVAHFTSAKEVWLGDLQQQVRVPLDSVIKRATFSHDGRVLYALGRQDDGLSTLYSIDADSAQVTPLIRDLDASPSGGNTLAITPQDDAVILPLASTLRPHDAERQKPIADRWLKLYRFDLKTHALTTVLDRIGQGEATDHDRVDPAVVGNDLYWVSSRVAKSVAVAPASGGESRELVVGHEAYLPTWSPDGKRIAVAVSQNRLVDIPLNFDVAIVDFDAGGDTVRAPSAPPRPFIVGNHEDFPPSWSPDGRWIAWHSHRAPADVPYYSAPGATDDIWLRRAEDLSAPEIRLSRDAWEAGFVYWSPDGRSVVYTTWDRKGTPGVGQVRTIDIDPQTGAVAVERVLALPASIRNPLVAEWSPLGNDLALEDVTSPAEHTLWIVSKNGRDVGRARKVVTFPSDTYGGISWQPDGKALAYAALERGRMQIFTVPVSGGTPKRVTDGQGNYLNPRLSPDGRWIAFSHIETVLTLHRTRLASRVSEGVQSQPATQPWETMRHRMP